jgi:hypothetical protein
MHLEWVGAPRLCPQYNLTCRFSAAEKIKPAFGLETVEGPAANNCHRSLSPIA